MKSEIKMSHPNRRLTNAQKREYELLKKHGSVYVYGWRRRGVFERLKELGLCYSLDWNWFHLHDAQRPSSPTDSKNN